MYNPSAKAASQWSASAVNLLIIFAVPVQEYLFYEIAPMNESSSLPSDYGRVHRFASFNSHTSSPADNQNLLLHILDAALDGYCVAHPDGTIAHINSALLRAAHLTSGECDALDLYGLLNRFRTSGFAEPTTAVQHVLHTGEGYECELSFADRNQTIKLRIEAVSNQIGSPVIAHSPSAPIRLVVTVRDITDTKKYKGFKRDMLSLLSHELRTPITSINGFAELLAANEALSAEAREFATIIRDQSQRLSGMVNTLLSLAEPEAANAQQDYRIPLRLDEAVREALTLLQSAASKKGICLVERAPARLPPIAANKALITKVIVNLVGNAVTHSVGDTAVIISTVLEADAIRVVVEDRGCGISPAAIARLWEDFDHAGCEQRRAAKSSGLFFVREVVEQHGGRVEVESQLGYGSKFSFTLPRL